MFKTLVENFRVFEFKGLIEILIKIGTAEPKNAVAGVDFRAEDFYKKNVKIFRRESLEGEEVKNFRGRMSFDAGKFAWRDKTHPAENFCLFNGRHQKGKSVSSSRKEADDYNLLS